MDNMLPDEHRRRLSRLAGNSGRVIPSQSFADRTRTIAAGFKRPATQVPSQRRGEQDNAR